MDFKLIIIEPLIILGKIKKHGLVLSTRTVQLPTSRA